jgi:putative hydrolase of the HAD superfamily
VSEGALDQTAAMPDVPTAVIFDLDGVIRDWNDDAMADLETAFDIPAGTILAIGFGPELGPAATTGRISYRDWMDEIRRRVVDEFGPGTNGALDEWEANIGVVDTEMLAVLRAVRRHCTVAVLSNGTTRLRRDLHALDLIDEFDVIYNTAEVGIAKPDPAVFLHVVDALDVTVTDALFIDDLLENVEGARRAGLRAHQHTDRDSTVAFLVEHGVPLG